MFSVPQFIDVEDKIAGPLTWKQLLWMIGLLVLLLMIYTFMGGGALFFIIAVPLVLSFSALAFYRPQGQSLLSLVGHGFFFLFRPKVAVWERPIVRQRLPVQARQAAEEVPEEAPDITTPRRSRRQAPAVPTKGISRDRLHDLARILDQGQ